MRRHASGTACTLEWRDSEKFSPASHRRQQHRNCDRIPQGAPASLLLRDRKNLFLTLDQLRGPRATTRRRRPV